jgi:hypothetical protein
MEFYDLPQCEKIQNYNPYLGQNIPPIDRLKIIGDGDFENLILEWANGYIKNNYYKVSTMAGSGDKGRDIVAYYSERQYDIYQCKRYANPLTPSNYWVEFGKLCYYTYNKSYNIPRKYYIVASNGIGQSLRDLIDNPHLINDGLIKNWNKNCKDGITKKESIKLEGDFLSYVKKFDFGIVDEISPINLIEQHGQTIWHKFRFGGGIKKREKPQIPQIISPKEENMNYVMELIQVYNQKSNGEISSVSELKDNDRLFNHFIRQREDFYFAQALKRFSRDEYIDTEPYDNIKNEIFKGIIDYCEEEHDDYFKKVNDTLRIARTIILESMEFGIVQPSEKSGICHDMVNEKEMSWVKNYE